MRPGSSSNEAVSAGARMPGSVSVPGPIAESARAPLHAPSKPMQPKKKKKMWLWLALLALLAIAVIAVAVGVAVTRNKDSDKSNNQAAPSGTSAASGQSGTNTRGIAPLGTSSGTSGSGSNSTSSPGATPGGPASAPAPAGTSPPAAGGTTPAAGGGTTPAAGAGTNPLAPPTAPLNPYAGDTNLTAAGTAEGTQANPRKSPYSAKQKLNVTTVQPGTAMNPKIEPKWLELTERATAGCAICNRSSINNNLDQLMFVYQDICFQESPQKNMTATIQTIYGGEGAADTSLLVFTKDRSEWYVDDKGSSSCTDGSVPNPQLCPAVQAGERRCRNPHNQCPGEAKYRSLSLIDVPLPMGNAAKCFNVAIGVENPDLNVAFVGLDGKSV